MTKIRPATVLLLASLAACPALAGDADLAAERARLANERIEAEAAQRAREEAARAQAQAQAAVPAGNADPAAERARLANQRIEAEAAQRAREDAARAQAQSQIAVPAGDGGARATGGGQAAAAIPATAGPDAMPTAPATAAPAPGDPAISRALEQLRNLGELRDAGYVTDEEFQRIKNRILDERF